MYLKRKEIATLVICGVATDYCVKYSVLDALKLNFKALVVTDACRGVNVKFRGFRKALQEMQAAGALLISCDELVKMMGKRV